MSSSTTVFPSGIETPILEGLEKLSLNRNLSITTTQQPIIVPYNTNTGKYSVAVDTGFSLNGVYMIRAILGSNICSIVLSCSGSVVNASEYDNGVTLISVSNSNPAQLELNDAYLKLDPGGNIIALILDFNSTTSSSLSVECVAYSSSTIIPAVNLTQYSQRIPQFQSGYKNQLIFTNSIESVNFDLNDVERSGVAFCNPALNGPLINGLEFVGNCLSLKIPNTDAMTQLFISNTNRLFTRTKIGNSATPWAELLTTANFFQYQQYVDQELNNIGDTIDNIGVILSTINQRFTQLLEGQYGVGKFVFSVTPEHPNSWLQPLFGYETFWRPVVGRTIMSVDPSITRISNAGSLVGSLSTLVGVNNIPPHKHVFPGDDNLAIDPAANPAGGTFGNDGAELADGRNFPYDASSTSSPSLGRLLFTRETGGGQPLDILNPVYLAYIWERYDPSFLPPQKIIRMDSFNFRDGNGTSFSFGLNTRNLRAMFNQLYGEPTSIERVRVIIEDGAVITAPNTSAYAIITGNWPAYVDLEMVIENGAIVSGLGGKGADGRAQYTFPAYSSGGNFKHGENGGPAILATFPLRILNSGILAGGAGGGGASPTFRIIGPSSEEIYYGNAAGGGGMPFGPGGLAGFLDNAPGSFRTGEAGYPATEFDIGTGGVIYDTYNDLSVEQVGGNGGYYGQPGITGSGNGADLNGSTGYSIEAYRAPGQGGLPGVAVTGLVTVIGNPVLGA